MKLCCHDRGILKVGVGFRGLLMVVSLATLRRGYVFTGVGIVWQSLGSRFVDVGGEDACVALVLLP